MGGSFFTNFLRKMWIFIKKCRPTFFAYSIAFWLDFQGFGASEIEKKRENNSLRNHGFLRDQKSASKSVFIDSGVIFGLHVGAPERPKIKKFRISSCFCVRMAFWVVLGPPWAPFWSHFEVIWSSFLMFFLSFSVIFPICVKGALMFGVSTGRLCFYVRKCGRERKRGTERNKRKRFSSIGSSFSLLW